MKPKGCTAELSQNDGTHICVYVYVSSTSFIFCILSRDKDMSVIEDNRFIFSHKEITQICEWLTKQNFVND